MALTAPVMNGEITNTSTISTQTESASKSNGSLDKDAFLQLLVTQMKYQDPLEPTSNTEYISQFAQFSELEEMQNLTSTMSLQRASSLVGQYVEITHTNETTGESKSIAGTVDYVTFENNKAYVSVGGELYSVDDITKSFDREYANAGTLAATFTDSLNKLPKLYEMTTAHKEVIDNLNDVYNDMTEYQKSFLSEEDVERYKEYAKQMEILVAQAAAAEDEESSEGEGSEEASDGEETVSEA
ncbi:MAG: flagellar hook capping protein [Lachnospiraceae bacterium]|nr:flagellar hook capping protein [Lachnospiraceae bacterium]